MSSGVAFAPAAAAAAAGLLLPGNGCKLGHGAGFSRLVSSVP